MPHDRDDSAVRVVGNKVSRYLGSVAGQMQSGGYPHLRPGAEMRAPGAVRGEVAPAPNPFAGLPRLDDRLLR